MRKIVYLLLFVSVVSFGQKTDDALTTQGNQIRNETTPGANTAVRIGNMFNDLTDSKVNKRTPVFLDSADITKRIKFQLNGLTTGTTHTVTWPNKGGTLAFTDDIVSPSGNFIISDTAFSIVNGSASINLVGILPPVLEAGVSFTLDEADRAKGIYTSSGSAVTVTVPSSLTLGYVTAIMQEGSGVVSLSAGANVNITGKTATTGAGDFIWLWLYKKTGSTSYYIGR